MALSDRNPNESRYIHGKKHWVDVIKNSGKGDLLIWRQPEEDFNTNSTLIVMPGEEAIFVKNGIIEEVFENGTYQLSTDNYPVISRIRNAFSGGISTFNCVVYFVRKADSKEILWGTDSPIQVRDKVYNIRTEAKVRGSYKVRIDNASLFLEKLIGNNVFFETQYSLNKYFNTEFRGIIKTAVSKFLNGLETELIGIDTYLEDLSRGIEPIIDDALSNYGLKCSKFALSGIDIDTSKYDQIDQSQIEQIAKTRSAQGDKAVMGILGDDWSKQKSYEVLHDLANNEGGATNLGAGIGLGLGTTNAFGSITKEIVGDNKSSEDPLEKLTLLKKMFDNGLITEEEFNNKKKEILKSI